MNEAQKEILKDINKTKKKADHYNRLLYSFESKFIAVCDHDNVKKETKHYEGSYLNTGEYEHSWICQTCKKVLKTKTESDGHYG